MCRGNAIYRGSHKFFFLNPDPCKMFTVQTTVQVTVTCAEL
jgi:hypothetical protein